MKKTILVVDDLAIFREPIETVLRDAGFDAFSARDGLEALAAMAESTPALVLLDIGMPALDGLSVLRRMRADARLCEVPVVMLTAEADRDRVVEAGRLGVSGYLLKSSFSVSLLMERVREALAGASAAAPPRAPQSAHSAESSAPARAAAAGAIGRTTRRPAKSIDAVAPVASRAEIMKRLASIEELKGFSPTITLVLKLVSSERSTLDAISRAIAQDQALSLKVLRLANSSVYSRGDRVDTVPKAVLRIGMSSIREAVLAIGVVERFGGAALSEDLPAEQFWEHSIACGIIASELCHALDGHGADAAFTCGLLHDLGRLILAELLGKQYFAVVEESRALRVPLESVESRMLGVTHAEIMDRLMTAWRFPRQMIDPIVAHHRDPRELRGASPGAPVMAARLALADRIAHALILGSSANETVYPIEHHCRTAGVSAELLQSITGSAREKTDDTKLALLSASHGADWTRRVDHWRRALAAPVRAIFVSPDPEIDALAILCRALFDADGSEPPNLLVVHCSGSRDADGLAGRAGAEEAGRGASSLPVLVLSANDKFVLPGVFTSGRRTARLGVPLSIAAFVETVSALLAPAQRAAA